MNMHVVQRYGDGTMVYFHSENNTLQRNPPRALVLCSTGRQCSKGFCGSQTKKVKF